MMTMMKKETGELSFPIWLLADSEPAKWRDRLEEPLDKRHPIRHNIWTSVLEVIQREIFITLGKHVDADRMYLRNAVQDSETKPSAPFDQSIRWHEGAQNSLVEFTSLVTSYNPKMIITFGWFAFAFALRATNGTLEVQTSKRSQTAILGTEFRERIETFSIDRTNILPLLHRSIAGGNFIAGHDEFCGRKGADCFKEAGKSLARILVQHEVGLLDASLAWFLHF